VLLALADGVDGESARLLQSAAPAGLYGAAFRTEAWMIKAPEGDEAAMRKMIADGNARRVSRRPDRIEVRQIWAVDRARTTYMASQERGSSDVVTDVRRPEPGADHVGARVGVPRRGHAGAQPEDAGDLSPGLPLMARR
jgi:hypothetical protein